MYKVYRVTNDEKTPMVLDKTMNLNAKEEVSIEYTSTIEEALNTDYFD